MARSSYRMLALVAACIVFLSAVFVVADETAAAPVAAADPAVTPASGVASRLANRVRASSSEGSVDAASAQESAAAQEAQSAMNDYIVQVVNSLPNAGWTAGVNEYFQDKSLAFVKQSCGLKMDQAVLASTPAATPASAPSSDASLGAPAAPQPYNPYSPYSPYNPYTPTVPSPYIPTVPSPYVPTVPTVPTVPPEVQPAPASDIPDFFDARRQWGSSCASLFDIRDQAGCGSCWAVSSAEVMTDRHCIHSAGARKPYLSEKNILTCCGTECGSCEGGYPLNAFKMWQDDGVVTGGSFGSSSSCQPYFLAPCNHHIDDGARPKCVAQTTTPSCSRSCTDGAAYDSSKNFGSSAYAVSSSVEAIQRELMSNGPIVVGFMVYEDFPHYKGGVYSHVVGKSLGGHAVKLLGWGTEDGRPYWLCANSWNTNWGQGGFFKISRGTNEGMIETMAWAGMPKNL